MSLFFKSEHFNMYNVPCHADVQNLPATSQLGNLVPFTLSNAANSRSLPLCHVLLSMVYIKHAVLGFGTARTTRIPSFIQLTDLQTEGGMCCRQDMTDRPQCALDTVIHRLPPPAVGGHIGFPLDIAGDIVISDTKCLFYSS